MLTFNELAALNAQRAVVKYSTDGGTTWEFARLAGYPVRAFSGLGNGYEAHCEVMDSTHSNTQFTDVTFARGILVQQATLAEVRGKKWSYERS